MDSDVAGAQKIFQQQFQMCPPWHKSVCLYNLACCDSLLGNTDSALSFLARSIDAGYHDVSHIQSDPDLINIRHTPAYQLLLAGIIEASAPNPSDVTPQKLYNVACFCCLVGNFESAVANLEKAVTSGFSRARQMSNNPDLTPLHSHPKWEQLVAQVNKNKQARIQNFRDRKPWRARKHCPPPQESNPEPPKAPEVPVQEPIPEPEIPKEEISPEQEIPEIPEVVEVAVAVQEVEPVMKAHLEVLREMGFVDNDRNLVALLHTKGDIEKAILHLLQ